MLGERETIFIRLMIEILSIFQNIFKSHLTALERHLNRIMEGKLTFADQTSPVMRNPRLRLLCNASMMSYPALIYKMHNTVNLIS